MHVETQDSEPNQTSDARLVASEPTTLEYDGVLRLGRYPIIRKLGEGGMGIVYACYDEALDRRVAVKLLNSRFAQRSSRTRLEREAQALARLSHPNVVHIYEFGFDGDSLYLAMEYIDGQTLRAWLRRSDRRWREIAEVLVQAGRGLAAAHAVGLVHRDFKPDNVMVGHDGRVRVLDFGLVRVLQESASELDDEPEHTRPPIDPWLTRPGTILGTPAYMAPEQHAGRPSDAKADQFAWCVVAYEAMFGVRPFVDSSAEAIRVGGLQAGEDRLGIPRRVRAAILRGLAVDPDARWPSLDALLGEISDALQGAKRRWLGAGAVTLIAALASTPWLLDQRAPAAPRCEIDESALAGTWDDHRRASIRAAFVRHGSELAPTLGLVERTLDAWALAWLEHRRSACRATWIDGVQSQALLDQRTHCLDRQRRAFGVLTELLADADAELIARSPELLVQLPELAACTRAELVELRHPMPSDPARAQAIVAGFEEVVRARALAEAGRLREADARITALSETHHDYPPLDLEIRGLAGERKLWHGDLDAGLEAVLETARAAEALHLDDLVASLRVRAAIDAAGVWGQPERERWMLAEAEAALARVGDADDLRRVELHAARGWFHEAAGEYEAALEQFEAGRALAERRDQPLRAELARVNVARMLANLGRDDEAAREFEAARAAAERELGSGAPRLAEIELDLGLFAMQRGRADQAAAHFDRARTILSAAFGDDSGKLARVNLAAGKLALTFGDFARARPLFEQVAALDSVPPEWRADAHEGLGVLRFYAEDYLGSLEDYARALELRERTLAEDHPTIAVLHSNIGESKAALGDHEGARAAFSKALTLLERTLPGDHFDLAFPLKGRGQSRLVLGDLEGAHRDLAAALALHDANPGEPLERADVEFSNARALALLGERERATALAKQARDRYLALAQVERAAAIDRWLSASLR